MTFYWIFAVLIGIVLLIASIIDIRTRKLNDKWPLFVAVIGFSYRFFFVGGFDWILPTIFLFVLGYVLWLYGAVGAADTRMLGALAPGLPFVGLGEMFFRTILFVIIWAVLAGGYALVFKIYKGKKKRIPLIPIFLLAFILINIAVH